MSELERRIFAGCGPEWDAESRARIMAILGEPAPDAGLRTDAASVVRMVTERVGALLLPLLGRRDRRAVFTGRWRRETGDPAELLSAHLAGDIVLGAHLGGTPTVRELAFDLDGATAIVTLAAHWARMARAESAHGPN
ncbi:MAG: hypothetical protein IT373_11930 [Polyangiaceae bacterium]|nr:hypothetical protein [Polyangiaceae bacterium]